MPRAVNFRRSGSTRSHAGPAFKDTPEWYGSYSQAPRIEYPATLAVNPSRDASREDGGSFRVRAAAAVAPAARIRTRRLVLPHNAVTMTPFDFIAILLTLSAAFGVVNYRTLRLPNSVGVLVISLLITLVMLAADPFIPAYDLQEISRSLLATVDLPQTLLNGVLSFLLFAGALQVDLGQLWARKLSVAALALVGTLLAVALFGGSMWLVFPLLGPAVPLVWCIVLGAILAPTDPVSVVGMLRRIGLPGPLQAIFAGESLFNDGVGVVVFGVALGPPIK